ncbi:MAG: permease-like cell division protein FtsX [Anaerovoracaceae bacterium]|nr:permease-like cell division protein FtsX [Bacillota bacterium]MEE0517719.1 permease-like cell division protein FtsX [Anaerovoracaceae bacterium]
MNSFSYTVKQGFTQIFRNRGMSIASIFSILAMLFILGIFFAILVNLNLFTEVVKQDYDQVEIFIEDSASQEQIDSAMARLSEQSGVDSVAFRTKEEALTIMKERWGESGYLLDSLGENPLPSSILVKVNTIEDATDISETAADLEGVEDVQYYQETVEKLTSVTNGLQIGALAVMAFLIVVCVVVVSNTIKLMVFARAREIRIMKYVGATNWFIRGPFMAEGIIIGIIAALAASGLMTLLYSKVVSAIGTQVIAIVSSPLISVSYLAGNMLIIFLALGISIGAWGSIVSMRKFLDA